MKALRRFTVRTHLPERLSALGQLSINLRWSWDTPTQDLFASIDPELWKHVGCDPVALLGQVTPKRLDELAKDVDVYARYLQGSEISRPGDLMRLRRVRLELEF